MRVYIMIALIVTSLIGLGAYKSTTSLDWSEKEVIPVVEEVTGKTIDLAIKIDKQSKAGKDIYLVITSPGGDVFAGSIVVSAMETAKVRGSRIYCVVPVLAASMALHFLNHCSHRYAFPESFLLFHEAKAGMQGTERQFRHAAEQMRILTQDLEADLISNLGIDRETYDWHNQMETLWTGVRFDLTFPGYLTIIRDVKLPASYTKSLYDYR